MTNIQFHAGAIDAGECISNGWNLVKPNYWMYFGITLIAIVLVSCIPCLNFFLIGPVGVGVYYVLLKEMRREPVEFGMMFKGFEKFIPAMVVGLIQALPGIIWTIFDYSINIASLLGALKSGSGDFGNFYQADGSAFGTGLTVAYAVFGLVFIVVSIVWGISFIFALPLLAEHDLGPVEALKLSARAAWSNIGGIVLLVIMQALIGLLGMIALCIGVFFVLPILYAANAFAYRQVFPMTGQPFNPSNMSPPPPTQYGNFGSGMQS